ncbi:ATP-dependent nuclease [Mycolicibacterium komossense]|uniref:AAA family ATPase n=1 Tax=Mycolicibacterium komossense TaxID=1779 RepID=A0ABT3CHX9_9MYCO|nr:AAA family ATPase [Mycolicibacterium komossense]MCV7229070.1 AAA family ATPase [Mycolicibacterium komossense]
MHISRVEIENFRNFEQLRLDQFPSPAVIVGENGVGKSNLLEAMRLVLDPSLPDTRRMLRAEDVWEGHPQGLSGGAEVKIVIELQGFDNDEAAKAVLGACVVASNPYTARLTYRFFARKALDGADGSGKQGSGKPTQPLTPQDYDFVVFGGLAEDEDIRSIRRDIAMRMLPALRDAEGDLQSWRRNPLRDLLESLPIEPEKLTATANAIAVAVNELTKDKNVDALQTHLSNRLGDMLGPRFSVDPTLGFASTRADELLRAVRLFVDKERSRSVSDSSLGSANVIYLGLLLEVLTRQRAADQFVATLVAVEEPEAHLHVGLQRRLFHYLLRSESSLILTTHSPHVAAVTPIASFVVLRRDSRGAATVGATTSHLPITKTEAEDLERYIDVSRAEILFAAGVIVVEGLAELYVLPAIASAAGFDLDSHGVVVASAHGTDFRPYRALLGQQGIKTPHAIVTDGDTDPDKRGRTSAGIKRGAALLIATQKENIQKRINELPALGDDDFEDKTKSIVHELERAEIYVGWQTLEADLCTLFGDEIKAAFGELSSSTAERNDVNAGVDNQSENSVDVAIRDAMLSRITSLGKGRFAQRLAAHISKVDLRARVAAHATGDPAMDLPVGVYDSFSSGYIFKALSAISELVRGEPLLQQSITIPSE